MDCACDCSYKEEALRNAQLKHAELQKVAPQEVPRQLLNYLIDMVGDLNDIVSDFYNRDMKSLAAIQAAIDKYQIQLQCQVNLLKELSEVINLELLKCPTPAKEGPML